MMLQIREGSAAKNLRELLTVVTPGNAHRCMFVTDDRHPADLCDDGHINAVVRDAIRLGVPAPTAFLIGCHTAPRHYGLDRPPRGAIAPGYLADLIAFDSLDTIRPTHVWKAGRLVAQDGELVVPLPTTDVAGTTGTVRLDAARLPDVRVPADGSGPIKVIVATHGSLLTGKLLAEPRIADGAIVSDPARDILKLVVVDRHTGHARTGVGFVRGFGLQQGALACSVAHDNHNLIAVGATDAEILHALRALIELQGGNVAVRDGRVLAQFALPVAGLISTVTPRAAAAAERQLNAAAASLGVTLPCPFMTLSFLALPPIPALKLTDHGLVDVTQFAIVPLRGE